MVIRLYEWCASAIELRVDFQTRPDHQHQPKPSQHTHKQSRHNDYIILKCTQEGLKII